MSGMGAYEFDEDRVGVIIGSGMGGLDDICDAASRAAAKRAAQCIVFVYTAGYY